MVARDRQQAAARDATDAEVNLTRSEPVVTYEEGETECEECSGLGVLPVREVYDERAVEDMVSGIG